jgi:hypothetical protein
MVMQAESEMGIDRADHARVRHCVTPPVRSRPGHGWPWRDFAHHIQTIGI